MAEKTLIYIRDNEEMDKTKWDEFLNKDFEEAKPEKSNGIIDVFSDSSRREHINYIHDIEDVHNYLDNHSDIYLNGHYYAIETTGYSYDCAEELRDDLIEELNNFQDEHAIIEEILEEMNEKELLAFFRKSRRLHFINGKITRSHDSNTEYYDDEDEED